MIYKRKSSAAFLMLCLFVLSNTFAEQAGSGALEQSFRNPPQSARPYTLWFWMNGNISKEGITEDLEAMARVGIGGAQVFEITWGTPAGPVRMNSPEWLNMIQHAAHEAERLGLEFGVHNCPGWSSSGGPWNTPEHGMKNVVSSKTLVTGPTQYNDILPQPLTLLDWYQDVAVLAFPSPENESCMATASAQVSPDPTAGNPEALVDENPQTMVELPRPTKENPVQIRISFPEPFTARTLTLTCDGNMFHSKGVLEVSDDGQTFRKAADVLVPRYSQRHTLSFEPVTATVYRLTFSSAHHQVKQLNIAEIELSKKTELPNLASKTLGVPGKDLSPANPSIGPEEMVGQSGITNLTACTTKDGRLSWDVPEGKWTILRIGCTPNGRENHPSPEDQTGLECDKLSKAAVEAHWDGMMGNILSKLEPRQKNAKSGFTSVHLDSYEMATQNWTQGFENEFRKRQGYDLTSFLPVFAGYIVDSPEMTERFLRDFRRTIADLFAENYAGTFAELAHKEGLQFTHEPYGNGPQDDFQYGRYTDLPMGEFWSRPEGKTGFEQGKLASSIGHIYGKKVIGTEAFTAWSDVGKWQQDPYHLKVKGDSVYCEGLNRFAFHRYVHQPWTNCVPGMTMGLFGSHFERTVTWWEQGRAWMKYLARCQYLLQKGQFTADVCFYCGEDAPNSLGPRELPKGYDYDGCGLDALMTMSVKNGCVVLPSGMRYRLLILPSEKTMTPRVLRKIKELVDAGANVIGPKPDAAPGLADYPACDVKVQVLANELWPNRIIDQAPAEALTRLNIAPDFACESEKLTYIHRTIDDADLYFVANPDRVATNIDCTFRVSGKQPELWHPETGKTEPAPVWHTDGNRTTVPLRFDPAGSVFVLFRNTAPAPHAVAVRGKETARQLQVGPDRQLQIVAENPGTVEIDLADGSTVTKTISSIPAALPLEGPWTVTFQPNRGAPDAIQLPELISWTEHQTDGVKYFSGTAEYSKTFSWSRSKQNDERYILDLGSLKNIAEATLNGRDLGILWKPPFRIDITDVLKQEANDLRVKITNLWPNRIIGDERLYEPDAKWTGPHYSEWPQWLLDGKPSPTGRHTFLTWHFWKKDDTLLESGLLGPVQIRTVKIIPIQP